MSLFVTNIQRLSIHDGPGIRTTVFLKGCSLRCFWCHNPETLQMHNELRHIDARCIGCGLCLSACPKNQSHSPSALVQYAQEHSECAACMKCAENCPAEALVPAAKQYQDNELLTQLLSDHTYYQKSGGGVTFSGGEPLLQANALRPILKRLREHGIHIAVDTAGNVSWKAFETVLDTVDLFLYDVKAANSILHQRVTGSSNEQILDNLDRLSKTGAKIQIRIPLIPGVNMFREELLRIADVLKQYPNLNGVDLLPFHRMASSKYQQLEREYRAESIKVSTETELQEAFDCIQAHLSIPVRCRKLEVS